MSTQEDDLELDNDLPIQDELTALKQRADLMGISYHPSIGLEKLRAKVNEALNGGTEPTSKESREVKAEETAAQKRARKRKEAAELIRIRVSCMNPAKNEWEGEIFTAGNAVVGTFTKYVPFNAEDGWHVPRVIYNQIIDRQCQIFVTKKDSRGNSTRQGKMIKEFAVEVLPNLTPDELQELAQRQAMSKSV